MAEYIEAYKKRYGAEPRNHTELMNFSKRKSQVEAGRKALSFKQAKDIMASGAAGGGGGSSSAAAADPPSSSSSAAASAPEEKAESGAGGSGDEGAGKSAMFAELSQGLSVTSGLKKVTADMKTKNRTDRSGKVPASATPSKAAAAPAKKSAAPAKKKKDPSLKKSGLRWSAEYFTEGVQTLETTEASTKEEVYLYGNSNCAFIVPTKVKAVIVDSCTKVQVQLTDVISTVELVNCKRCTLYLQGKVQSVVVDKCSDPKLVMALPCFKAQPKIVTSMISDMMVEVAGETEEDDFKEYAIPYQFESFIDPVTREMTTVPVEHG